MHNYQDSAHSNHIATGSKYNFQDTVAIYNAILHQGYNTCRRENIQKELMREAAVS